MWEHWYGVLAAQVAVNGRSALGSRGGPHGEHLMDFMGYSRRTAARGTLSPDRVAKLDRLDFEWDAAEAAWTARFESLVAWKAAHGTFVVRLSENESLAQWARLQRCLRGRGELAPNRAARLAAEGFPFDPVFGRTWERRYMELIDFHKQHGHTRVSTVQSPQSRLSKWLRTQRSLRQSDNLSPDRAHRLAVLGVQWKPQDEGWDSMYTELVEYTSTHGTCDVLLPAPGKLAKLGRWLQKQRVQYKKGVLHESRVARLEELGLAWNVRDARWTEMFNKLARAYGETRRQKRRVTLSYDPILRTWLRNQRAAFRSGKLSTSRAHQLRRIGVDLDPHQVTAMRAAKG
jgi:Helicase associated domain